MTDAEANPSVAIVGGSITGPLLALLLHKAGFTVDVYEATPRATSQAGGVIGLDHVSLDVLDTIGVPQEEIVPFPSQRIISVKVADRREAGQVHTMYPGRNTSWTLINNSLLSRLPAGSFHPGMRVRQLSATDGGAVLDFQSGEQITADLVAFTDGRRSTGRRLLDPDRDLRYSGYVAWRGQLPWCPPNLRDFTSFESPGTQFNAFPILRGEGSVATDWTFYTNLPAARFTELFDSSPADRTFILPHQMTGQAKDFATAKAEELLPPRALEMVRETTTWMAAPVVDIAPPTTMAFPVGDRHAVLIGDALAPVRPHVARGANNGIQQASGLATALRQHLRHGADLTTALRGWEQGFLPLISYTLNRGASIGHTLGLGTAPHLGNVT